PPPHARPAPLPLRRRLTLYRRPPPCSAVLPHRRCLSPQIACPSAHCARAPARFLETRIPRHAARFSGQCSPLELLFNEQHRVPDALYRDNPASACLNRYTAQIA
ncbi:hypothetical protein, partial [Escherichia coli]|uniref:hypothetical protein n=1 Tax=Escherichia coli TaxID=562 RepID=UPI0035D51EFA